MKKKRVIKREMVEKHTRVRPKTKTVKMRTNVIVNDITINDVVENIVEMDNKKSRKSKKYKDNNIENTSIFESVIENNE